MVRNFAYLDPLLPVRDAEVSQTCGAALQCKENLQPEGGL
jgi:hypothetical protein